MEIRNGGEQLQCLMFLLQLGAWTAVLSQFLEIGCS